MVKMYRPAFSPPEDMPYTSPEEDPFNITPLLLEPRRRRSSMLNKWIQDQQLHQPEPSPLLDIMEGPSHSTEGAPSNPYLAYPDLGRGALPPSAQGSTATLNSYDFVEDEDIPDEIADLALPETPHTPVAGHSYRSSRFLQTPSSFRSLHLSFRSNSPRPPSPSTAPRSSTPTRTSFFPLASLMGTSSSRHSKQHNRSSSLGTLNIPRPSTSPQNSPAKWRPSVLGHFGPSSTSQISIPPSDTLYTPSRPSMSSSHTYTSATVTAREPDIDLTPSKTSLVDSIRSRSRSHGSILRSGAENIPSIRSMRSDMDAISGIGSTTSFTTPTKSHARPPLAPKPGMRLANSNVNEGEDKRTDVAHPAKPDATAHIAFSAAKSGTLPRVSFSSLSTRQQKKKKLIISGIGPTETRKFEGAKRWCESFGEVSQIMRMPNGDLHVHFRSADVADTVCRLRAKVYIAGVGSVNLSWYTGNKR